MRGYSLELVMESLAFHLFDVGTFIFVLCSYDCSPRLLCCSLLDCCDLVGFLFVLFLFFFFHLMLAGRQPFGVLRWFQLLCFFHLVSA